MGMYKSLGRGLSGLSCESYVFSDATGAAPPVVTYYASPTFWHSIVCSAFGGTRHPTVDVRLVDGMACCGKLACVEFYGFECFIFHRRCSGYEAGPGSWREHG